MLGSYRVYDADAHVILAPAMWKTCRRNMFRDVLVLPLSATPVTWRPIQVAGSSKDEWSRIFWVRGCNRPIHRPGWLKEDTEILILS